MVSQTTLTIIFGYAAAFWSLEALSAEAGKIQTTPRSGAFVPRLAAGALLPAVVATFALTTLLLFAHVRALGGANAAAGAAAAARRRRFLERLANATLAATAAALLAGAVLRLGGGGDDDDIGWLWLSTDLPLATTTSRSR